MNKKIQFLFFMSLVAVLLSLFGGRIVSYVTATTTNDASPPLLTSVSVSPNVVSPGSYFVANVSAGDSISGVKAINVILESLSGQNILHKESYFIDTTGQWFSSIFMPSNAETGMWKVKSIYLVDNSGNSKTYLYPNEIATTFSVAAVSTATQSTEILAATTCASFTYSDWSSCQSNGTQTRSIVSSFPSGCVEGDPVLIQTCSNCSPTRPYLNTMNGENCVSSRGTWNSSNCVCACPAGYKFEGTGCLYSSSNTTATCTSFIYSDWSSCSSSGARTRTVASSYPSGCTGGNPVLSETCTYTVTYPTCTSFAYSDWSACQTSGIKTRSVLSSSPSGCTGGNPVLSETCTYTVTYPTCTSFAYSDWSACQTSGTQTRTILSSYPSGCTSGSSVLSQACTYTLCDPIRPYLNTMNGDNCVSSRGTWNSSSCVCTCPTGYRFEGTGCLYTSSNTCTSFTYSDWSACQSSGVRTRTVSSSYPSGCTGGNSVLSETCTYSPTTANICTSFTYSDWSACQSSGVRTRTVSSSYPSGCTGGNSVLSQACTYTLCDPNRPYLNIMNGENCVNSGGTWNSSNCVCTCPAGYKFEGTGCLYIPPVVATCTFTYSDWSSCVNGTQTRTVVSKSPANCTGGQQESLSRYCLIDSICQKDEWTCGDWSSCINGKQTRTCKLSFDCPGISEISPKTEQSCTVTDTTIPASGTVCQYKYSEYGECQNGKQYRKITEKYPQGCVENAMIEPLERTCTVAVPTSCSYAYSSWSECKNGTKTRSVVSKIPENCLEGNPVLEEKCRSICADSDWKCEDWNDCSSGGIQYRKCILSSTCLPVSTLKSPQTERACVYKIAGGTITVPSTSEQIKTGETTTETVKSEEQLPAECIKIGWVNKKDCELYLYHSRIISDCRNSGLSSQDQCRNYLLTKYGKPLKCEGMSDEDCNSLINNVILSELKMVISPEIKEKLIDIAGHPAVIDVQNKTITVEVVKEVSAGQQEIKETKEVKMENMPIVSNIAQQVSVSLVSTETGTEQQNLSPVAIAFDSDGDGLPDDVEKRLGTDPNNKDTDSDGYSDSEELRMGTDPLNSSAQKSKIVLSGVDRALVDGKTLEQPKYNTSTPSVSLAVISVATVKPEENKTTSNLKFEGKAKPNQVITLFIYSTMPIVVTVQADSNGNWTYELDKTMVDGTHEVYVAINNDEGKIVETSLPTPFFIQEALAVSVDDFIATGDATQIPNQTTNLMMLYVLSGLAVILLLVAVFLIIKQRFAE